MICIGLMSALFFGSFSFTPAQALNGRAEGLREEIDEMTEELTGLEMEYNRAIWESFIAYSQANNRAIPIYGLRGHNFEVLFDTVRHIGKQRRQYQKLAAKRDHFLNKDAEYRHLIGAYRNAETAEEKNQINRHLQPVIRRIMQDSKRHRKVNHSAQVAMRDCNLALTRFMLDHYDRSSQPMPLTAIPEERLKSIRREPSIYAMEVEKSVLRNAISGKLVELGELKYKN